MEPFSNTTRRRETLRTVIPLIPLLLFTPPLFTIKTAGDSSNGKMQLKYEYLYQNMPLATWHESRATVVQFGGDDLQQAAMRRANFWGFLLSSAFRVAAVVLSIGLMWLVGREPGTTPRAPAWPPLKTAFWATGVCAVGSLALNVVPEVLFKLKLDRGWASNLESTALFSVPAAAAYLLSGILTAPVYEELLFRGGFQRVISKFAPARTAIVIQGVLFGLWHYQQNLAGMVLTFIGGLLFGFIYFKTQRLWVTIIMHAILNIPIIGLIHLAFS